MQFVVTGADDGQNLSALLRSRFGLSRGMIRRLKRSASVEADGFPVPMRHRVRTGERITVRLPQNLESNVVPEPVPLAIVYEDPHLLVLDKPPGMLVHPARHEQSGTLANGVAHHLLAQGLPSAAGPVTRLDRDTSGLVLFAKHPHAHHRLSRDLETRTVARRYIAVVHGRLAPDDGTVDAPILKAGATSSLRVVDPAGQRALTHYRVLARISPLPELLHGATLVELCLETGRTHQIRVHMAYLGHPLVGDRMYGAPEEDGVPWLPARQALHAYRLELRHPMTGDELRFASSPPPDLAPLIRFFGEAAEPLWGGPG